METAAVGAGEASRDESPEFARQEAPVAYQLLAQFVARRRIGEVARARKKRQFSGETYVEYHAEIFSCALSRRGA
jgi:hypothetical protein